MDRVEKDKEEYFFTMQLNGPGCRLPDKYKAKAFSKREASKNKQGGF